MCGSIWLSIKSEGYLQARASSTANKLWPVLAGFAVIFLGASSSPLTLKIMLVVAVLFVPIVLAYQIWTYHFF